MRIIDIYREDADSGTGFRLIAENLIQTGENSISYARNAKVYTMADGSLAMYPAEKDKIQMTLSLECTEEQADLLCDAQHYGKLYFAGAHSGTKKTATPTDGMKKRLQNLLTVKSIVTLILTITFSLLSAAGKISGEQFMTVFATVIAFYFGTQHEKQEHQEKE